MTVAELAEKLRDMRNTAGTVIQDARKLAQFVDPHYADVRK